MVKLAEQTETSISLHVRRHHGYDIPYAVSAHPKTLLAEHDRYHSDDTSIHLDHDHEGTESDV